MFDAEVTLELSEVTGGVESVDPSEWLELEHPVSADEVIMLNPETPEAILIPVEVLGLETTDTKEVLEVGADIAFEMAVATESLVKGADSEAGMTTAGMSVASISWLQSSPGTPSSNNSSTSGPRMLPP